jgi:GTP cyclohydrolase I
MDLLKKANENLPRTEKEKAKMISNAAKHYGKFLESLGFDYQADPQTLETPTRVAKSWVNDLIKGSLSEPPLWKEFPNEQSYSGLVIQTGIRVNSMCAHHNLPFVGWASIAYLPGTNVVGLSKLNRIVDWHARRPQMQESLTQQVHDFIQKEAGSDSVAVSISSKHMCCGLRGIKHPESVMTTNWMSGKFMEPNNLIREEFLHAISKNGVQF